MVCRSECACRRFAWSAFRRADVDQGVARQQVGACRRCAGRAVGRLTGEEIGALLAYTTLSGLVFRLQCLYVPDIPGNSGHGVLARAVAAPGSMAHSTPLP